VILSKHLGDAVLALPALRLLATSGATDMVVVAEGAAGEVVRGQGAWRVVPARGLGPGPAVLFSPSLRSALRATRAGASPRIGEPTDHRGLLIDHSPSRPPRPLPTHSGGRRLPKLLVAEHQADAYLRIARAAVAVLGLRGAETPFGTVEPGKADSAAGEAVWRGAGRPRVVLHPCVAGARTKRWAHERWVAIARELGESCVVTGGPSPEDAALVEAIAAEAGVAGRAGDRSLPVLPWAALARRAGTVVAPDTGVGHLARAVGAQVVALFGSSDPLRHAPRGPGELSLLHGGENLSCSPCYRDRCVAEVDGACMERVQVVDVLQTLAGSA